MFLKSKFSGKKSERELIDDGLKLSGRSAYDKTLTIRIK
jgi:hypothetical protein